MSSNVCEGIQLAPAPPKIDEPQVKNNNGDLLGGWNFIEALTNTSKPHQKSPDTETVYVHPLAKRSASMLSEKSLEMCTESLGSETGSDTSNDNFDYFSPKSSHSKSYGTTNAPTLISSKKTCRRPDNFPPPLTSISGPGGCVRVNSHREDGRLVLKAVTVPVSKNLFHVQRVNGRLTLHFVSEKPDTEAQLDEDVDGIKEDETEEAEIETFETELDDSVLSEDMDVINGNVGGKIGREKFRTTRRCKQNGHRIKESWNLDAYWVASS